MPDLPPCKEAEHQWEWMWRCAHCGFLVKIEDAVKVVEKEMEHRLLHGTGGLTPKGITS